jgi:hypothetical protein
MTVVLVLSLVAATAAGAYTPEEPAWLPGVSSTIAASQTAEYNMPPTIAEATPASGPIEGGGTIIVTGSYFRDGTGVTFGDVPASSVTVERYDRITVLVPPHDPGVVELRVTTYAGSAAIPYEYVAPPAPPVVVSAPSAAPTPPPPAPTCVVPRLRGLTTTAARAKAVGAGCALALVKGQPRGPRTRVTAQDHATGSTLPAGSIITVRVRRG